MDKWCKNMDKWYKNMYNGINQRLNGLFRRKDGIIRWTGEMKDKIKDYKTKKIEKTNRNRRKLTETEGN